MSVIVALDQGTTSCRAIVFNEAGQIQGIAQKEFEQSFPQPGWVEHDPNEIWSTQLGVTTEALSRANISERDVAALGITNQRETTVIWNRHTGEPIHPAIVWQDRRTADDCQQLVDDGLGDLFRTKTGLIIDAYFSGTKIAWLLNHIDGARQRAERGDLLFGTIETWLVWKLTQGEKHLTDASNASRTLLYNIHSRDWDDELLAALNIPRAMLPTIVNSSKVIGEVASPIGLKGIPIASLVGDQQAATFGQMCTEPGMAKSTYGTGCFILMNTGDQPAPCDNQLLSTVAWQIDQQTTYALEGSIFVAGAIVQWLRDGLKIIRHANEIEALATSVPDSGGVYLVPALTGLGAPHWDPHARGTILGITRGTTDAHIARAALEGIAFQVADLVQAMQQTAGTEIKELRVDGGAARNNFLMQCQADLLGIPVVRPTLLETTALGTAYLAGLAVNYWPNIETLHANWQQDERFEPAMSRDEAEMKHKRWQEAVRRSKDWSAC